MSFITSARTLFKAKTKPWHIITYLHIQQTWLNKKPAAGCLRLLCWAERSMCWKMLNDQWNRWGQWSRVASITKSCFSLIYYLHEKTTHMLTVTVMYLIIRTVNRIRISFYHRTVIYLVSNWTSQFNYDHDSGATIRLLMHFSLSVSLNKHSTFFLQFLKTVHM